VCTLAGPPSVRAIGRAGIRHHHAHLGALRTNPGQSVPLAGAGSHLRVGQTRAVIAGYGYGLPAGPRTAQDAVEGNALAYVPEAASFLVSW